MTLLKNWNWIRTGFLLIFIISFLFFSSCQATNQTPVKSTRAINGILDLSKIDFNQTRHVKLDGYWQFYWNRLLTPEDFLQPRLPTKTADVFVPNSWTRYDHYKERFESNGYATYRLVVILPENNQALALNIMYMTTAYKMWINGQPVPGNGVVGRTPLASHPQSLSRIISFLPRTDQCEIIVQVSNFSHRDAGITRSVKLGKDEVVRKDQAMANGVLVFITGCILSMGIYHLLLFSFRRTQMCHFFFGLVCFLICLQNLATGTTLITQLFPGFSWEILRKIIILCIYFMLPGFTGFINAVFPKEFPKTGFKLSMAISTIYAIPVLVFPVKIYWHLITSFNLITLGFSIYTITSLVRALIRKREGASALLFGSTVFIASIINEILYSEELVQTGSFIPLGFLIMILSQALVLAMQYSKAYNRIETLVRVFEKFVPSRFQDRIARKGIGSIAIGNAENDTIAVLFCDLRSFTTLSEKIKPKQVLTFLNAFFNAMSTPIHNHHGFIDKFIGDAVMALFDANGKDPGHCARNAVRAAIDMQRALVIFNQQVQKTYGFKLEMGIGIHIGRVVIGTVGTKDRMDSTVLGDAVNIASRLENMTKKINEKIIISSDIVDLLDTPHEFDLNQRGNIIVKGRTEPIFIYGVQIKPNN